MRRRRLYLGAPVALGLVHLAGGRPATSALAGIAAGPVSALLGISYVCLWLTCVLVVPALLLGAGIDRLWTRLRGGPGPDVSL